MKPVGFVNFDDAVDSDYEDLPRRIGLTACLGCLVRLLSILFFFYLLS